MPQNITMNQSSLPHVKKRARPLRLRPYSQASKFSAPLSRPVHSCPAILISLTNDCLARIARFHSESSANRLFGCESPCGSILVFYLLQQELKDFPCGVWDYRAGAEDRSGSVLIEIIVVLGWDDTAADDHDVIASKFFQFGDESGQ